MKWQNKHLTFINNQCQPKRQGDFFIIAQSSVKSNNLNLYKIEKMCFFA